MLRGYFRIWQRSAEHNARNIRDNGVSTIHEDRHKRGLVMSFAVAENIILEAYRLPQFSKNGILNLQKIRQSAERLVEKFDVRPTNCVDMPIRSLSCGN